MPLPRALRIIGLIYSMNTLRIILPYLRLLAFLAFLVGLSLRLLQWPGGTLALLVAMAIMLLALVGSLVAGGWAMSHPDEKVRVAGHLCILYGASTYLDWLWDLPMGLPAIGSGVVLLLLANWLRRRRRREETAPETLIDEIGRQDEE